MGDQLFGLEEKDETSKDDHGESYPLDWIEEARVGKGLAEEGEEELHCTRGGEGEGEGVAGMLAPEKLTEEKLGEERRDDGCVESDRVESHAVGRDAETPGESGRETGIAAFGEVSESEEAPSEGGAWGPGIKGVEERKL